MNTIAIFGAAGKMGGGILRALLTRTDYLIQAYDVGLKNQERLKEVQNTLWNDLHNFKRSKQDLRFSSIEDVTKACERVKWLETCTAAMFAFLPQSNVVIEAIFEDFDIKKDLYENIEKFFPKKNQYIFTNTSTITISSLAECLKQNERFMGLHFFNPVPVMPVIEAIIHLNTSGNTIYEAGQLAAALGKKLFFAPDIPGFVVNGCYVPAIKAALDELDASGASIEEIDNACTTGKWISHPVARKYVETLITEAENIIVKYKTDARMQSFYSEAEARNAIEELMKLGTRMPIGPLEMGELLRSGRAQEIMKDPKSTEKYKLRFEMGPFKFIDLVGVDVALDCVKSINNQDRSRYWKEPKILADMRSAGNLGLKTGKGFYQYSGAELTFPEKGFAKIVYGDGKRNSLSIKTIKDLRKAFRGVVNSSEYKEDGLKAVFLQSRGKHFATGADITEFPLCLKDEGAIKAAVSEGAVLMWDIADCKVPVIALLEGMALGGGCELALACDAIIAKEGAIMGLPEKRLGILPGWGGTQRLTRRVGLEKAIWMILGGEQIKTEIPWVDAVLKKDEFNDLEYLKKLVAPFGKRKFEPLTYSAVQVLSYAKKLFEIIIKTKYGKEPKAVLLALRTIWNGNKKILELGLLEEYYAILEAFKTEEAAKGIRHFLATGEHLYKDKKSSD